MTKVIMHISDDGSIMFDCVNHAGKKDVCIMCSTLVNVLITACRRENIQPTVDEDGHLRLDIEKAGPELISTFRAVRDVFYEVEDQFPFFCKNY